MGLQVQVAHLVVQLVEQIALSVDQEWSADQVDTEASMGAASTHIARENVNLRDRKTWRFQMGMLVNGPWSLTPDSNSFLTRPRREVE